MPGDSLPFISLPFPESLVRCLFSSLVQNEQLGDEALDIANILGIQRRQDMKIVTKENLNVFQVPKIKDENRKSGSNLQIQSVKIKKEVIQEQFQSSHENESQVGPCYTCGHSFRDKETLKAHLKIHKHGNDRHKCNVCSKIFSNKYTLARHVIRGCPHITSAAGGGGRGSGKC